MLFYFSYWSSGSHQLLFRPSYPSTLEAYNPALDLSPSDLFLHRINSTFPSSLAWARKILQYLTPVYYLNFIPQHSILRPIFIPFAMLLPLSGLILPIFLSELNPIHLFRISSAVISSGKPSLTPRLH